MKCPWSCGWEGEPKEYSEHLPKCPKAKEKAGKSATLGELFRGTTLNGFVEAARVRPLTEFVEEKPKEGKQLKFTTQVLGLDAAVNLRNMKVVQTIRSDKEIEGLAERDLVTVTLDDAEIGKAMITSIDKVRLSELAQDDAERGGFSTLSDLQAAAARAGYRFKPLSEYLANRVLFTWKKEVRNAIHKLFWLPSPRSLPALWSEITIEGKPAVRGYRELRAAPKEAIIKEIYEFEKQQIIEANYPWTPLNVEYPTSIEKIIQTVPSELIKVPLEKPPIGVVVEKKPEEVYKRKEYPIEEWYILFAPHIKPPYYQFEYKIMGSWNLLRFEKFEDLMNLLSKGREELNVHATRGKEIVTWKPVMILPFRLTAGQKEETAMHIYTLIQPILESPDPLTWKWRVSVYDKAKVESAEREMTEAQWEAMWKKLPWQAWIPTVLGFITEKTKVEGWASHDQVHKEMESLGMTHEEVDEVVSQLEREGIIYTPREGYYKKT